MRKIPDLRRLRLVISYLSPSPAYSLWLSSSLLVGLSACLIVLLLGCSHLSTPEYASNGGDYESNVGEYQAQGAPLAEPPNDQPEGYAPGEVYESAGVLKLDRSRIPKEAFKLHWPISEESLTNGQLVIFRAFKNMGNAHLGLDLAGPTGTPIYAAHSGIIIFSGTKFRGFGKMIILEYDNKFATLYGHMSQLKVKTGQWVPAGHMIGLMGRTGGRKVTGPHLHFEVMKDKIPVDPLPLLPPLALPTQPYQRRN